MSPTGRQISTRYVQLYNELLGVSGILMREALSYKGIDLSKNMSVDAITHAVIFAVEDGKVTESSVRELILDASEYGTKTVYLYRADKAVLKEWNPPMGAAVIASRDAARVLQSTGQERMWYVLREDSRIRMAFSEEHINFTIDMQSEGTIKRPVQRVITVEANSKTGDVTLTMDGAGRKHHHGTKMQYMKYWKERAAVLLGATLEPLELANALTVLQNQDIVEIKNTTIPSETGEKIVISRDPTIQIPGHDVRLGPIYKRASPGRIGFERDEYSWLPQSGANGSAGIPRRVIDTTIFVPAGEVKFTRETLSFETEYVLGHLRANA